MDKSHRPELLRHISLRQLQIFETVARLNGFTRAAEELHLTQPTVSMQIKKLEDRVGSPLFELMGKRIFMTSAGTMLLKYTRQVLDALSNVEMEIANIKGLKTGTLKLAVVTTAKYFASRALGRFCTLYPGIDVTLKVTNRERLLERLSQNIDDLYIIGQPPQSEDVVFEPYMVNPLIVLASCAHPLKGKRNIDPKELTKYAFITRETGSDTRMAVDAFFSQRSIKLNIRMELGSNEAIKHAIDSGFGISVLSRHTLALEGMGKGIIELDVKGFPLHCQWYVGHEKGKQLSIIANAFLQFIKTEVTAHLYPLQKK